MARGQNYYVNRVVRPGIARALKTRPCPACGAECPRRGEWWACPVHGEIRLDNALQPVLASDLKPEVARAPRQRDGLADYHAHALRESQLRRLGKIR